MSTTTHATTPGIARSTDGTEIGYDTLGAGPGLLVLSGAWRSGRDYVRLARALAPSFTVHLIDRRGRGRSGPQGTDYSVEREVEDLLAVQAQTGATAVFGHSFGGLVALEAARRSTAFSEVIVYEPGVSVSGSIPIGWMPIYRERLAAGDARGAFAAVVRGAGAAPRALAVMPLSYVKLILRLFIRGEQWRRMEPLMQPAIAEHEQVAALDEGSVERYGDVRARVLLLGGSKSPSWGTTTLFDQLCVTIPDATGEVIDGLSHVAPDEQAPEMVAERVRRHLGR